MAPASVAWWWTALYITKAMDYWDLPGRYGSLDAAMARVRAACLLISFDSDWLYPPPSRRRARRRCGGPAGHDAFLVDHAAQQPLMSAFLAGL